MDEKRTTTPSVSPADETDALESFLQREQPTEQQNKSKRKLWLILAAAGVIVLAGVFVLLSVLPDSTSQSEPKTAEMALSVDDEGEHQAQPVPDEHGEVLTDVSGTLLSYAVADIARIDVKNESGSFSVLSQTPTVVDENGDEVTDATVYTLVGYEDLALQDGVADDVANDASVMGFDTIISTKGDLSDFGLDDPRASVTVTYTDGTAARLRIGDVAAADAGTYIAFGDSDIVYLSSNDAVDAFLYSVLDFMTLEVTAAADDTDSSIARTIELSGTRYHDTIVLESNCDDALNSDYLMTEPKRMQADAVESADIAGDIRGLYAEAAVYVNPDTATLASFGLDHPYARVRAKYADTTVTLIASAPDDSGAVYLMKAGGRVIYTIQLGAVEWANTDISKLIPETVLDLNMEAVSGITVRTGSDSYDITVVTSTESVENDDGETEDVTTTNAYVGDEQLDFEHFSVFFQNLNGVQITDPDASSGSGTLCTVTIRFSTGREDMTVMFADGGSKVSATLDGLTLGAVYKNTVSRLIAAADDLVNGRTVTSF